MMQARNFAVMTGVNAGITCAMRRWRGVEDVKTRYLLVTPDPISETLFMKPLLLLLFLKSRQVALYD
jgi:hypothetical protein